MATWDDLFGSRKWRVATELDGEVVAEPGTSLNQGGESVRAAFSKGKFELFGGVFHSPLSSARGRKGVLLQEVNLQDGMDILGSRIAVGVVVFRRARAEGAIR